MRVLRWDPFPPSHSGAKDEFWALNGADPQTPVFGANLVFSVTFFCIYFCRYLDARNFSNAHAILHVSA